MTTINYGAAAGVAASRAASSVASRAVGNIATGTDRGTSNGAADTALAAMSSYGAKNMSALAAIYEGHAGVAAALVATTQSMAEIASKYSQVGLSINEYRSAGVAYIALDAYRTQLIGTPAQGTQLAFTEDKGYAFHAGGAAIAAASATRNTSRGTTSTTKGGIAGMAATVGTAAANSAAHFAGFTAALAVDADEAAQVASEHMALAMAADGVAQAAGLKAAGHSAAAAKHGTDFAAETATLAAAQIKAQAATAMVAQAAAVDQTHLALLN